MNLYLVFQTTRNEYNICDSFIVRAANETDAKNMHPASNLKYDDKNIKLWDSWVMPKDIKVKAIGNSISNKQEIICVSCLRDNIRGKEKMYIYLVSQSINKNKDAYGSFTVCAAASEEARNTHPASDTWHNCELDKFHEAWVDVEHVKVQLLGESLTDRHEVICASYNQEFILQEV